MRVSIVIPCLNQAVFLRLAIDSVLQNGYSNIECVVVDGLSEDGCLTILENAKLEYGESLVYVHEKDSGPSEAYNKGCEIASGEVVACIGADDLVASGAIGIVAGLFQANPDWQILYGECDVVNQEGLRIGRYAVKDFSLSVQLNEGCCVQFPSCYYRKSVLETIGGLDLGDVYADLDWLARCAQLFEFHRVANVLSVFRFHSGGLTGSTWNTELPKAMFRLNRKYRGRLFSTVGKRYFMHRMESFPVYEKWMEKRLRKLDWRNSIENGGYYIFGAALTGYACLEEMKRSGRVLLGFIDNYPPVDRMYCDLPVLKPAEFAGKVGPGVSGVVVATGGFPFAMVKQIKKAGWSGPVYCYS